MQEIQFGLKHVDHLRKTPLESSEWCLGEKEYLYDRPTISFPEVHSATQIRAFLLSNGALHPDSLTCSFYHDVEISTILI